MFDLVTDVGGCQIIVKSFGIVFYGNFTFSLALVLPFDVLFLQVFIKERFYKRVELFLLVVSC